MTRTFLPMCAFFLALVVAAPVFAESDKTVLRVALNPPDGANEKTRSKFADIAAKRIEVRLEAAGVKMHKTDVVNETTLRVEAHGVPSQGWLEALVTANGDFELRPVKSDGPNWLALASEFPAGVEIREGSDGPYVWSSKRGPLKALRERVALPSLKIEVFPDDDGGWRTLNLGPMIASRKEISAAKTRISGVGRAFVSIRLKSTVVDRLAASESSDVKRLAVILDGEVAGLIPRKTVERARIELTPPRRNLSREERRAWVNQVAGRLAAFLPIEMAVLRD